MIRKALESIRGELNLYLDPANLPAAADDVVLLANIAHAESAKLPDDKVLMSLINIEEEFTLKNGSFYKKTDSTTILKHNPTVHLNMYVLFAINAINETKYFNALIYVSKIIAFFQRKPVFISANTPNLDPKIEKLIVELFSPNFEQLNHLWGMLGGKSMPSVMYKVRMVMIEDTQTEPSSVITEIELNTKKIL